MKWAMSLCVLVLAGCVGRVDLDQASAGSALVPGTLATRPYPLAALLPPARSYSRLRVYIEGDGHAWATRSQPSTDPTPAASLMVPLALADSQPSAYLARPCQYVQAPGCVAALWTDQRFDQAQMQLMNAALDRLEQRYNVRSFELIGHSGGAAVALVLAGMRDDVVQVQTLAGNLDPAYWATLQHLSPLPNAVTPLMYRQRLQGIAQRHFLGDQDTVVPPAVAAHYLQALQGGCVEVVHVAANHAQGYDTAWQAHANQPIHCAP